MLPKSECCSLRHLHLQNLMKTMTIGKRKRNDQQIHVEYIEMVFSFTVETDGDREAGNERFGCKPMFHLIYARSPNRAHERRSEVTHENKSSTLRLLVTTELEVLASLERQLGLVFA